MEDKKQTENLVEKSFDLKVIETKELLVKTLNEANLPLVVMAYILKELIDGVNMQLNIQLQKEKNQVQNVNNIK